MHLGLGSLRFSNQNRGKDLQAAQDKIQELSKLKIESELRAKIEIESKNIEVNISRFFSEEIKKVHDKKLKWQGSNNFNFSFFNIKTAFIMK